MRVAHFIPIFAILLGFKLDASQIICQKLFQHDDGLASIEHIETLNAPNSVYLNKLKKNNEPALAFLKKPEKYKAPDLEIKDNRRLYETKYMTRFAQGHLVKMYRGMILEANGKLVTHSTGNNKPIWMAPHYEHARLYTMTGSAEPGAKHIIIEMLIPDFLIYWKEDPRIEELPEAFILESDINNLESFITEVHHVD